MRPTIVHTLVVLAAALCACISTSAAPPTLVSSWSEKGSGAINAMAALPTRGHIALACRDGIIRIIDPTKSSVVSRLDSKEGNLDFAIADPKEKWVAGIHRNGAMCVWNLDKREIIRRWSDERLANARGIAGADGDTIITFNPFQQVDLALYVWSVATGKEVRKMEAHKEVPNHLTSLEGGAKIVSADYDGTTIIWDGNTGRVLRQFEIGDGVYDIVSIPKTSMIVSQIRQTDLAVWDTKDGKKQWEVKLKPYLTDLAVSPTGDRIAVGDQDFVRILDASTGKQLERFQAHVGTAVNRLLYWDQGKQLITVGCGDGDFHDRRIDSEVKVWKLE
jgi:WD40 repeat protein